MKDETEYKYKNVNYAAYTLEVNIDRTEDQIKKYERELDSVLKDMERVEGLLKGYKKRHDELTEGMKLMLKHFHLECIEDPIETE